MLQRLDRTDFKSNVEDAGFRLGACLALECCFPVDKWDSCFNYRGSQHALRRIHESKTTREREKFFIGNSTLQLCSCGRSISVRFRRLSFREGRSFLLGNINELRGATQIRRCLKLLDSVSEISDDLHSMTVIFEMGPSILQRMFMIHRCEGIATFLLFPIAKILFPKEEYKLFDGPQHIVLINSDLENKEMIQEIPSIK